MGSSNGLVWMNPVQNLVCCFAKHKIHIANGMIGAQALPGQLGRDYIFASTSSIDVSISIFLNAANNL